MTFKIATTVVASSIALGGADMIEDCKPRGTSIIMPAVAEELTIQTVTGLVSHIVVTAKTCSSLPKTTKTMDTFKSFTRQMETLLFRELYFISMSYLFLLPRMS